MPILDEKSPLVYREIGAYPYHFIQMSMPYRAVDAIQWTKHNGDLSMTLTAGAVRQIDGTITNQLPFGKHARSVLMYICTHAREHGNVRVNLSKSLRGFMRELGIKYNDQRAREVLLQFRAVLAMTVTTSVMVDVGANKKDLSTVRFNVGFTENLHFEDEELTGDSYYTLSSDFYNLLVAQNSRPVDMDVWAEMIRKTKSPMAIDIYLWLTVRMYTLAQSNQRVVRISWDQLYDQFGSQISSLGNFKIKFRQALDKALTFYPEARVMEIGHGAQTGFRGLMLKRSPLAVSPTERIAD